MNKRYYEHTLPIIRGSLSNTYLIWNWNRTPRMYISPCLERTNMGMRTMTVSMWSAGLKTFISPAGSIHAGSSTEKTAGTKLPPIAGTGSRIRFRARKEEPLSG